MSVERKTIVELSQLDANQLNQYVGRLKSITPPDKDIVQLLEKILALYNSANPSKSRIQNKDLVEVHFIYPPTDGTVQIAFAIDEWKPKDMKKTKNLAWVYVARLPPGSHQFKFVVNSTWTISKRYEIASDGPHTNNVVHVPEDEDSDPAEFGPDPWEPEDFVRIA
eukprot:TRINITY_DN1985_c0_g1_i2.p1 TRINITY_DN1985_c0_g1~~TRINITY_DN1985_c0_g1_i2.p1  ORF type:complete len:178 (-),score=17.72 TRINITY_DN1985_c0_g1_i2:20-517(-)